MTGRDASRLPRRLTLEPNCVPVLSVPIVRVRKQQVGRNLYGCAHPPELKPTHTFSAALFDSAPMWGEAQTFPLISRAPGPGLSASGLRVGFRRPLGDKRLRPPSPPAHFCSLHSIEYRIELSTRRASPRAAVTRARGAYEGRCETYRPPRMDIAQRDRRNANACTQPQAANEFRYPLARKRLGVPTLASSRRLAFIRI